MSYLDRIHAVNRADLTGGRRFILDGQVAGWIMPEFAERLREWPGVFSVTQLTVELVPALASAAVRDRSVAVAEVLDELRTGGMFPGWRDERYAVAPRWGEAPGLEIERACAPYFGITGYGVHLNGWCRVDGEMHLWVATRAAGKPTDPGKLDQLVAGGQPAGLSLHDNLIKECAEEAGIAPELASQAIPVSTVTYAMSIPSGFRPDVLFVFDLETPPGFVPRNTDGEVASFELWPVADVARTVRDSDAFKFNCALVVIDFLIRHGIISPEEPGYAEIVAGLRGREAFLAQLQSP